MRITNILLVSAALTFAGCNSTPVKEAPRAEPVQATVPARIEIQEAVGFTIFEDSNITGELRLEYDRAQDLLAQGRLEDAIELLEKVAEAAPTLSAPRIDLGIAYHQLGAMEAAEAHLNTALAINASHPVALNELGIVYRKTARNFNPPMAMAGLATVAEVEDLVDVGQLDPDHVHTAGIFVQRVIGGAAYEKRIERLTVRD